MGKKIGVLLLTAVISFAAGFWIYRLYETRHARESISSAKTEPSRTPPPLSSPTESGASLSEPPTNKGAVAGEPTRFSPRTGEVLDFAANVTKLNSTVATLRVKVGERRSVAGKSALHLQAF